MCDFCESKQGEQIDERSQSVRGIGSNAQDLGAHKQVGNGDFQQVNQKEETMQFNRTPEGGASPNFFEPRPQGGQFNASGSGLSQTGGNAPQGAVSYGMHPGVSGYQHPFASHNGHNQSSGLQGGETFYGGGKVGPGMGSPTPPPYQPNHPPYNHPPLHEEYQYGHAPMEGGYKHGQMAQLVMKMMNGEAGLDDVVEGVSFLSGGKGDFWTGLLIGVGATLLISKLPLKDLGAKFFQGDNKQTKKEETK